MGSKTKEHLTIPDYSKKEILEILDRILTSDLFSRSVVLSRFLKFIVEETIKGNTEGLKEYTIAVSALGKSSDFNPQTDAIVRIHAGRLRRLLDEYYTSIGKTDAIKIEVIKGSYVPVFRSNIAIEPDLIITDKNKSVPHSRSKLTIAILPFRNLCPDNEYQFFVDGFGEELTRIFSKEEDVSVIAHYSARKYTSIEDDIRLVGANLGAHYLVNGSVKRSNKEIRVSVGLIETLNGELIWSKDYTHLLENDKIIDIQDQIDEDVFSILSGHYGFIIRDSMSGVKDTMKQRLSSFDAILWNYYTQMTHSSSMEACAKSREALEKVLEVDGSNVMCLIMLADLYTYSNLLGYPTIEDPVNEAYRLIKKAIRLEPLSQYAYIANGWVNVCLGKKEEAIKALEYSMELGPLSASAMGDIGFSLICAGEYKQSHVLLKRALNLNPYCPWWYYLGFFFIHYKNEDYNEALKAAQKMNASEDVFLDPLLNTAVKGQLGLISDVQKEIQILNQKFQPILSEINLHLEALLLDHDLINNIAKGVTMAGLKTS
ncbi:hypothetical protein [Xanthomarina sp. GH4-25]|uniref:hypothetical protein n=1 Tax=Xanthomarina sp. GH4-25 TaxID=3349335 RepID=UPI0038779A0E